MSSGETMYLAIVLLAYAAFALSLFACMAAYMASRRAESRAMERTHTPPHVHAANDDRRARTRPQGWKQQAVALQ
jgi:hypothetical protein